MSLGINIDDLVLGLKLSQALNVVHNSLLSCMQLELTVLGLMLHVTLLMNGVFRLISMTEGCANFWQDNIIGAGIYDCKQGVHW